MGPHREASREPRGTRAPSGEYLGEIIAHQGAGEALHAGKSLSVPLEGEGAAPKLLQGAQAASTARTGCSHYWLCQKVPQAGAPHWLRALSVNRGSRPSRPHSRGDREASPGPGGTGTVGTEGAKEPSGASLKAPDLIGVGNGNYRTLTDILIRPASNVAVWPCILLSRIAHKANHLSFYLFYFICKLCLSF